MTLSKKIYPNENETFLIYIYVIKQITYHPLLNSQNYLPPSS